MDRGSRVVSRIANLYPERFIGFGFLALGYQPPAPTTTFEDTTKEVEKALGRDTLGYQLWLSEEGTAKIIKKNVRSSISNPVSSCRYPFAAKSTRRAVRFLP